MSWVLLLIWALTAIHSTEYKQSASTRNKRATTYMYLKTANPTRQRHRQPRHPVALPLAFDGCGGLDSLTISCTVLSDPRCMIAPKQQQRTLSNTA